MAPVIWGLDLKEIQWWKFKSSYMWNTEYHLRRTKFIVYQCAMIACVVSESLGTAVLSDYIDEQNYIEGHSGFRLSNFNNDYVGAASYNIFVGVYVATIFGSGFFFDLFWPERHESKAVRLAWKICAVLACIFTFASAITLTVITATRVSTVKSVVGYNIPKSEIDALQAASGGPPLVYRTHGRAIASVVLLWIGLVATIASTIIMWKGQDHDDALGPKSTHAREHAELEKNQTNLPPTEPPSPPSDSAAEMGQAQPHSLERLTT